MASTERPPKVYTRAEAMAVLRIGRTKLGDLIKSGELRTRRAGTRVLISQAAIEEYLGDRSAA